MNLLLPGKPLIKSRKNPAKLPQTNPSTPPNINRLKRIPQPKLMITQTQIQLSKTILNFDFNFIIDLGNFNLVHFTE